MSNEKITQLDVKTTFWPDASANPFLSREVKNTYAIKEVETMFLNKKYNVKYERNYTIIKRKSIEQQNKVYVRITKPVGGYKFFIVTPSNGYGYTEEDYNKVIKEANEWFLTEYKKCLINTILENLDSGKKRKNRYRVS